MRKFESTKKGRLERASLTPTYAERRDGRESDLPVSSRPGSDLPKLPSWRPPAEQIVQARMLPDTSWSDTQTTRKSSVPASPGGGYANAPSIQSMIPRAPELPREGMRSGGAQRSSAPPQYSSPPQRYSTGPDTRERLSLT